MDPKRPLKPGEIWVGEPCPAGHRPYARLDERGEVERGHLEPLDGPNRERAVAVIYMGAQVEPGIRKIRSVTPLRQGPAAVSSDAYRTGWDGIFGKKARAEGLN